MVWQRQEIAVHVDQAMVTQPRHLFSSHSASVGTAACGLQISRHTFINFLILKSCSLKSFSFISYYQSWTPRAAELLTNREEWNYFVTKGALTAQSQYPSSGLHLLLTERLDHSREVSIPPWAVRWPQYSLQGDLSWVLHCNVEPG